MDPARHMAMTTVAAFCLSGNKPCGVILASGLGEVRHLCFSPDDQYVAVFITVTAFTMTILHVLCRKQAPWCDISLGSW